MNLSIGQTIVHPHHGPATITDILTRTVRGIPTKYLRLEVHRSDLVISVPCDCADDIGLRDILDATELEGLYDVLRAPTTHEEQGWSRRFKGNIERVRIGQLLSMAEVVRDLMRREHDKGLSLGEKHLLKQTGRRVAAEISLATACTDDHADAVLEALVFDRLVPQQVETLAG